MSISYAYIERCCVNVSHPFSFCKIALSALAPLDYESAEDMVKSDWIRMEHQGRLVSTYITCIYEMYLGISFDI